MFDIIYLLLIPVVVGDPLLLGLLLGLDTPDCAPLPLDGLDGADLLPVCTSSSDSELSSASSCVSFAGLFALAVFTFGDIPALSIAPLFGLLIGLFI